MSAALASARLPASALAQLWQADQLATPALPACASGFEALDAQLPGGGWPAAGLTELLFDEPGCGEIQLLAPALQRLAGAVWIAPPCPPYAPALHSLGVPIGRTIWVRPATEADAAWAAEQVLRSGCTGAVLWWSGARTLPATLRRLHLAAQEGNTPLFALRPLAARAQSSPAPLRLALEPAPGARLQIDLFKRRGPSLAQPLLLRLPQLPIRDRSPSLLPAPTEDVVVGPVPALAAA
jgi:protein ImuA